ncbi:MAG: hypothetical protein RJA49_2250 [Actinomycetota bacterium]
MRRSTTMGYPRTRMEPTVALPEPPPVDVRVERPLRRGELTPGWSTAFWLGWACVTGGFAAVWYSSRITGMATWWLGPETQPRFILVSLIPFLAPLGLSLMALAHRPWMPWWGILGAAITAAVAALDIGGPARYFAVEFVLAGGGLLVSLAAFAGLVRDAPAEPVTG